MVGRFCGDDPHVWDIPTGTLLYTSTQADCPPLSAEKFGLSLSHLVQEIPGPKVGLIFNQNVLINIF